MSRRAPTVHKARKRFGQNFLQDERVIDQIIDAIRPKATDHIVEIGPGLGAITEQLLQAQPVAMDVIELDRDLTPILRTKFFNAPQLTIHEADALNFDFRTLQEQEAGLRIVGNLPYNISTPLIFHLLAHEGSITDMHFMLQKEVVDRMSAGPGEKQYGRLSIMTQYYCRVLPLFEVPPESFDPVPKVMSAIVRLKPHRVKPIEANNVDVLQTILQSAFSKRRKTLRNALSDYVSVADFEALQIEPSLRPENLSVSDFVALANRVAMESASGD